MQRLSLTVAVIARPRADLRRCLAALERAGAGEPAVLRIGRDGPAMARNRALAACDSEVLALVEDDVAVEPEWFEALGTTWTSADEVLGCVGGPLRAAFPEGRPGWLSDDLLDAFAVLDLGDEIAAVDARNRTFHSGNVSFRTAALRAVGGFWPSRGHRDGRDWFSEEHEAQRELGRAGWRAAYVPEVAAARIVGPDASRRAVVRRRLRYGARRALIGGSRHGDSAARQLATSALGTPLAFARRRPRLAMERAVRAAESAGALLAAPLAHADLQPVAPETPFLASVPPPQPRRRRFRRRRPGDGPVILLYHRIAERESDPLATCVSPPNLAAQLEVLSATREVVPLAEMLQGDVSPRAAAITFDDGYHDNLEHAAPALAAAGMPATVFVATSHVAEQRCFWWDELVRILSLAPTTAAPVLTLELAGQRRTFRVGSENERHCARRHLQRWLQPMPPESIGRAIAALRAWGDQPTECGTASPERPMTIGELRAFADTPGLAVGAHSRSHRCLRHADEASKDAEIAGSRDDVAAWLGFEPTAFSYPFGVPEVDFDDAVAARVRAAGFSLAVTTRPGPIGDFDHLRLPRWAVPDVDGETFEAWLRT